MHIRLPIHHPVLTRWPCARVPCWFYIRAMVLRSPASTLSQNVMRVRDYMLGEENSARRANMHGCTRTPGQGPPELAEEDRMIVTDAR